ncbi:MAG: orotate phosphoribosyltransferase [Magnetovibrio sp.]|nr:orotate phosphoribosyltransferase [Magnetovibrio sp.]
MAISNNNIVNSTGLETAKYLLDIKAVNFRPNQPYKFTSGWVSPVYIDCRWIISFVEARRRIIELGCNMLEKNVGVDQFDVIAGGETAGIPYASWISESLSKPMLYVRKEAKGFGRNAQIEGNLKKKSNVLLVEDLATDGGSKINFVNALRNAGANVTDIFVIFFYSVFPDSLTNLKEAGVKLHYLATWHDVIKIAEEGDYFSRKSIEDVKAFLQDPIGWSKAKGGRSVA